MQSFLFKNKSKSFLNSSSSSSSFSSNFLFNDKKSFLGDVQNTFQSIKNEHLREIAKEGVPDDDVTNDQPKESKPKDGKKGKSLEPLPSDYSEDEFGPDIPKPTKGEKTDDDMGFGYGDLEDDIYSTSNKKPRSAVFPDIVDESNYEVFQRSDGSVFLKYQGKTLKQIVQSYVALSSTSKDKVKRDKLLKIILPMFRYEKADMKKRDAEGANSEFLSTVEQILELEGYLTMDD